MSIKKLLLPIAFIIMTVFNIHNVSASVVFKDLSKKDSQYNEITYLVNTGVINGYKLSDGYYFKGSNAVNRQEVAKMVVLAAGYQPKTVTKSSFSDVQMSVMTGYIEKAVELGFMEPTSKGKFSPTVAIKRDEMSKILVKAFRLDTEKTKSLAIPFTDVAKSSPYYPYVAALYYEGITNGMNDTKYGLTSNVTRTTFSTFIARMKVDEYKLTKPVLGVSAPIDENANARVFVTTDELNVRTAPSTSAASIGKVHTGSKLNAYAVEGNWVKIAFENQFAYVSLSYVKFIDTNGMSFDLSKSTSQKLQEDTVMYRGTDLSTKQIATLKSGTTIKVYGTKDEYTITDYNGIPGYILTADLMPVQTLPKEVATIGVVTADSLNIRQTASSSAAIIGKLKEGESVNVLSIDAWWAKIDYNGTIGYVHKSYLHLMNTKGTAVQNRIIVLDPGHGGSDPGAVNGSVTEKSIVLDVAKRVQKLLQADGAKVVLTRSTDVFIELDERPIIANNHFGEMFISIHVNSFSNNVPKGTETFYNSKSEANLDEEIRLAKLINNEIVKNASMTDRGVKNVNYAVTRNTTMPAILTELGFIKNESDFAKLTSEAYLTIYAESIYNGIVKYYSSK